MQPVTLNGVWADSYWTAPLEGRPEEDLGAVLARVARWLSGPSEFFANQRASGGSASLFVGFFLEGFNAGFSLEPSLLAEYASLGIALDFDLYGPDESPGAP